MARRRQAEKRNISPDAKYDNVDLARFINKIMLNGKRSVAQKIVYKALDDVEQESRKPGLEVFRQALRNVTPMVQVKARRVGGATYQVPVEVRPSRRNALAMRWLVESARKRGEKSMTQRLAGELMDAADNRGAAARKKDEVHRMAEANKAFSHYRF